MDSKSPQKQLTQEIFLLQKVMQVSLRSNNPNAFFLQDTVQQLFQVQQPSLSLTPGLLQGLVVQRFSLPQTDILSYSTDCYFRIRQQISRSWSVRSPESKDMLQQIQSLLVSYTGLSVTQPQMFPQQLPYSPLQQIQLGAFRLFSYFLHYSKNEFLVQLMAYLDSEFSDMKSAMLELCLGEFPKRALETPLKDGAINVIKTFKDFLELSGVQDIFLPLEWGNESWSGEQIENNGLGVFFSKSFCPNQMWIRKQVLMPPLPSQTRDKMFEQFEKCRTKADLERVFNTYRGEQNGYSDTLLQIVKKLLRIGKDKFLNWVAACIRVNGSKQNLANQLQLAVQKQTSSDGFVVNLLDIFLSLCMPILNSTDDKSSKIDPRYLCGDRLAGSDPTSLCYDAPKFEHTSEVFGTITEFYFICLKLIHLGWYPLYQAYMDLNRINNQLRAHTDPRIEPDQKYFGKLQMSYDIYLFDDKRCSRIKKMHLQTMTLLVKWVGFSGGISLPPPNEVLGVFPQDFLEDINEFFFITTQVKANVVNSITPQELIQIFQFAIIVMFNPDHFKNPYIRAKLAQNVCLLVNRRIGGDVVGIMGSSALVSQYFLQAIIRFYVDAESTGTHTQFYDKFQYRHLAAKVFQYLWSYQHYREQTLHLQTDGYFIRFVNMLINDTTFCLDDGLKKIQEIKEFQDKLKQGIVLTNEEEKNHEQFSKYANYMFQQANESISLLLRASDWNSGLFMEEEFKDRTAQTLNYYLQQLCGPRCLQLKVDNPQSFNFKPKELLKNIIVLYINLGRHQEFYESIVRDQRCFDLQIMQKALRILRVRGIVSNAQAQKWEEFIGKIKETSVESQNIADMLGDIPDEFLCPISFDLMRNPVKLPSGYVVDKMVISRHLLSTETDPFTRQPLKMEQCEPDLEMKQAIDDWIASKVNN